MGTAAIMDLQSSKHALAKRGLPEELPLHYSAALGGFTYGLLGGKVWNVDYLVSLMARQLRGAYLYS